MAYSKQNFQDGQILNAANLEKMENGIIAGQGAENLLDNSNFMINQRGKSSYAASGYTVDRWKIEYGTIEVHSSYLSIIATESNECVLKQFIDNLPDGTYTFAAKVNGVIKTRAVTISGGTSTTIDNSNAGYTGGFLTLERGTSKYFVTIRANAGYTVTTEWAALYEGSYTADTLPAYVPKGKHVEMLNCNVPLAPRNLLDNSDFRNPVNQRGQSSWHAIGYTIDRWRTYYVVDVSLTSSGIKVDATSAAGNFRQNISSLPNGTYTFAAYVNGVIKTRVFTNDNGTITTVDDSNARFTGGYISAGKNSGNYYVQVVNTSGYTNTIAWAALYEGAYDASTLPAYQPKGYAAELAECQRYYRTMGYPVIPCGNNPAGTQVYGFMPFRMRIDNPTVSCDTLYFFKGDTTFSSVSSASATSYGAGTRIVFNLSQSVEGNLAGAIAGNGITLNADL